MKIFCLYYDDKYSPDYVSKLYRGIKRHYKKDFTFICYTDNMNVESDVKIPLPQNTKIKKHWHKLKFFDSSFANQELNEDIIILDIDQIIVKDLSPVFDIQVNDNEIASYEKWDVTTLPIKINGGYYKFKSGQLDYIWNKYNSDPEYWQMYYFNKKIVSFPYYGEQNFVQDTVLSNNGNIKLVSGKHIGFYMGKHHNYYEKQYNIFWNSLYMKTYKEPYMFFIDTWNDNICIVHFCHVLNDIHSCNDSWIKRHWI